jgi:hypothetical protein
MSSIDHGINRRSMTASVDVCFFCVVPRAGRMHCVAPVRYVAWRWDVLRAVCQCLSCCFCAVRSLRRAARSQWLVCSLPRFIWAVLCRSSTPSLSLAMSSEQQLLDAQVNIDIPAGESTITDSRGRPRATCAISLCGRSVSSHSCNVRSLVPALARLRLRDMLRAGQHRSHQVLVSAPLHTCDCIVCTQRA